LKYSVYLVYLLLTNLLSYVNLQLLFFMCATTMRHILASRVRNIIIDFKLAVTRHISIKLYKRYTIMFTYSRHKLKCIFFRFNYNVMLWILCVTCRNIISNTPNLRTYRQNADTHNDIVRLVTYAMDCIHSKQNINTSIHVPIN
jgi:hypothetical protein